MRVLAEKINEYRKDEADLKDALLGAQKMGNTIINEAKAKAEAMIAEASTRADRLVYDSQKQAEDAINAIQKQVDKEKKALTKMQKEVSDFKSTLLATYKRHLNLITGLPEVEEKEEAIADEVKEEAFEEVNETAFEAPAEEVEEITVEEPEEAPAPAEEEEEEKDVSTMRFEKVAAEEEKPTFVPARKTAFEEKFGELKFGRNNNN